MKLGILGAGLIAQAVATLALKKGHEVMVSNSRGPQTLGEVAASLGCQAGTAEEAAAFGDMVLVAIPFHACRTLSGASLAGKVVMDACNHYPGRDGADAALDAMTDTSGQVLARQLPGARVVKVFTWPSAMVMSTCQGETMRARPSATSTPRNQP
jgi:predicted dinucleotide-binding enzyme